MPSCTVFAQYDIPGPFWAPLLQNKRVTNAQHYLFKLRDMQAVAEGVEAAGEVAGGAAPGVAVVEPMLIRQPRPGEMPRFRRRRWNLQSLSPLDSK